MEIIWTNVLTNAQVAQIRALEERCFIEDALENHANLSNEINFDRTIPTFFLAYENKMLIGFLTFFIPTREEAEISAFVHPAHRRKGAFTRLDAMARREIAKHHIGRIVYSVEAKSRSAHQALRHWGVSEIERSEYRMVVDRERVALGWSIPDDGSFVAKRVTRENAADHIAISQRAYGDEDAAYIDTLITSATRPGYIVYRNDAPIGIFALGLETPGAPWIYGVAIAESERGKGYGKWLMGLACGLAMRHGKTVQLDVDSDNPVALQLYRSMGFITMFQVDYYIGESLHV